MDHLGTPLRHEPRLEDLPDAARLRFASDDALAVTTSSEWDARRSVLLSASIS